MRGYTDDDRGDDEPHHPHSTSTAPPPQRGKELIAVLIVLNRGHNQGLGQVCGDD